jgi:ADP-heptose:LPS heptosyltransferase
VVLRALKLGDLLTVVPALRALARSFPDHHRVLAAPAALAPLALHVGGVDVVVDTPALDRLDPVLHGADVAVNLHGRGPQSTALLAASRPRRLIAFDHGPGAPEWRADEHEVARWCRLLVASGIAADPADLHVEPPPRPAAELARDATVIHPGAADPARRWPPERWAAVARAEAGAGRPVVITGGPDEGELARAVARSADLDPGAVLAGRTDLLDLVAVVAEAGRVVCGDTGVAHVATAVGTPSVTLFGPVPPSEWGPPPLPRHVALWKGERGDPHADEVDPGLLAITVGEVVAALDGLPG